MGNKNDQAKSDSTVKRDTQKLDSTDIAVLYRQYALSLVKEDANEYWHVYQFGFEHDRWVFSYATIDKLQELGRIMSINMRDHTVELWVRKTVKEMDLTVMADHNR